MRKFQVFTEEDMFCIEAKHACYHADNNVVVFVGENGPHAWVNVDKVVAIIEEDAEEHDEGPIVERVYSDE